MHYIVSPKHASQGLAGKRINNHQPTPQPRQKARPFRLTAIQGLHHQSMPSRPYSFARLFVTCDRLPGAPGKAKTLANPADQCRLQQFKKIGGNRDRPTCSPGKRPQQMTVRAIRLFDILPSVFLIAT